MQVVSANLGLRHGIPEVMQCIAQGQDVPGSEYYFRESMISEVPAGRCEWLNRLIPIGHGERRAGTHVETHLVKK